MSELPAARWAADPYGRHEMRYWDGAAWTAHVSDAGVTGHDLVPGVAAGQAAAGRTAAQADDETQVMASAPASGPEDSTVAIPVVAGVAAGGTPVGAALGARSGPSLPGPGVDEFFGGAATLPVQARPTEAPAKSRTGLVVGVAGLAVVGLVAGVVGFSGLPDGGDTAGSDAVVPVAVAPTTSPATDPGPETATDEPLESETLYGGPTTSPAKRTTTTVRATTTEPRTTTSTTPRPSTTKPRPTRTTLPTTVPPEFRQYPSCQAMNRDYPHGVGRPGARDRTQGGGGRRVRDFYVSAPLYFVNAQLDVDGDGIACEA